MSQVREREELRDTMSEAERLATVVPTAEEVRALVEGPPRRRQVRWMRWLGAFAALVLAAGIAALLARSDGTTSEPEVVAGGEWMISVDSPQFESLPLERPIGLPDNGYVRAIQTPHGVSFDFVVVTQTPHGVSIDAFVPQPFQGNPTQVPAGQLIEGTVWLPSPYVLPEMSIAEGLRNAQLANYQLPEMSLAEGMHSAQLANFELPEMSIAEGAYNARRINYQLPEMSIAEGVHNAQLANDPLLQVTVAEGVHSAQLANDPLLSIAEGVRNARITNWELPEMSIEEGMQAAAS